MAIYRGALPTDNYTQVLNAWLRDPALKNRDKGVLCSIASHREDYELTVAQLVAQSDDGEAAVYSALRHLAEVGYLRMQRTRDEAGKLRETDFHLVAEPPGMYERVAATLAAYLATRPRKSPSGEADSTRPRKSTSGESTRGGSTRGESMTKKTKTKKTRLEEDHPSPPAPAAAPPAEPVDVQEEEEEGPGSEALEIVERVLARAGVPAERWPTGDRADALAWLVVRLLAAGWESTALVTALGADSMADARSPYALLMSRLRDVGPPRRRVPHQPARAELPTWCGRCDKVRRLDAAGDGDRPDRLVPCPRCHPDNVLVGAAR